MLVMFSPRLSSLLPIPRSLNSSLSAQAYTSSGNHLLPPIIWERETDLVELLLVSEKWKWKWRRSSAGFFFLFIFPQGPAEPSIPHHVLM